MATAAPTSCASTVNCPAFIITQATPQVATTDPSALTNTAVCNSPAILSSSSPTQGPSQQATPIRNTYEEFLQQYKQANGFATGGVVNLATGGCTVNPTLPNPNPSTNPYGITPGSVCYMQTDNPVPITTWQGPPVPGLTCQIIGAIPYIGEFYNGFTGQTTVSLCQNPKHAGLSGACIYGIDYLNGNSGTGGIKNLSTTPYYGPQYATKYVDLCSPTQCFWYCSASGCPAANLRNSGNACVLQLYPEYNACGQLTGYTPTANGQAGQYWAPSSLLTKCCGTLGPLQTACLYPEYNQYFCIFGIDKSTAPGSWIPPWEGGNSYCPWGPSGTVCASQKYTPGTYNNYPELGPTWWQASQLPNPNYVASSATPPPTTTPPTTTGTTTPPTTTGTTGTTTPPPTTTGTGTTPMPTCTTTTGTAPGTTGTGTTTTGGANTPPGSTIPPSTCVGSTPTGATQVGVPVTTPGANTQIETQMQQNAAAPQLPAGTALQPTLLQNSPCLELNPNTYQVNTPQATPTTVGGIATVCPITGLTANGYTAAQTCPAFTIKPAQGQVDPNALVSNQLQQLTCFKNGTPGWAQPAINAANSVMAARGLGSSTIMGGAFINAVESAALPVAQANAQYFANLDTQNLSNEQQAIITGAQLTAQALLSNTAAQNAALQFNAQSANQTEQFMANLNSQIQLTNAAQINAMQQFNAGQLNSMSEFNANMANNVAQFNAQNRLAIDQSNVTWRRNINTLNTAAINAANQVNTQNLFNLTSTAQNDLWQQLQDQASWANTDAQNALTRAQNMAIAALGVQTAFNLQNSASQAALFQLLGSFGINVGGNLLNNITNSLFSSNSNSCSTAQAAAQCHVNTCPDIQNVLNG